MTKKTILILCLAVFSAGGFAQQRQTVDKIVANVGNSVILYSDVVETEQQMIKQYRAYGYTPPTNTFYAAFEQLLEIKLGYNQALVDSVKVDLSGVNGRMEEAVAAMVAEAGSIRALEAKNNMPIFDLKSLLTKRLEEQEHYQSMRRDVVGKVKITPGEVEAYFKSLSKDSIIPDQYMYAQITKYPPSMTEAKQRLRERMLGMRADLISGASRFEVLARLYSKDTESANRGGELAQPLAKNEMQEPFSSAVVKLKPGQYSGVVETESGFHIIEVLGMVGNRYRIRHIVMTPEYTGEEIDEAIHRLDSIAAKIRQDSISFEDAARYYSDDTATRMNGGLVTNIEQLATEAGMYASASMASFRFIREQFAGPALYRDYEKLIAMKPGDISDAYRSFDNKGNVQGKLIKLLEFYPTHKANLAEDYLVLESLALNKKTEDVYAKWLGKTIQATYVRIDPAYRDGLDRKWIK